MKYSTSVLLLVITVSYSYSSNKINYLEPVPGANVVSIENNIIIGFERPVALSGPELSRSIIVRGSGNQPYTGTITKYDGGSKIIFKPSAAFKYDEKITVSLTGKLLNSPGGYEYSFNTSPRKVQWDGSRSFKDEIYAGLNSFQEPELLDPPLLSVIINDNPSSGYLFLAPYYYVTNLVIADNNGHPYWYSGIPNGGDFKKQPNGNLTYFEGIQQRHYEMNENYHIVHTYSCGNGYTTDIHELRILSNGHALVMAYDPEIVDMRPIIQGGDSEATVIGLIIQEVDASNSVVFQWRSWDHFAITDALHENLLAHSIDCVHGNAIEIDNDGNLLLSSRHLDEITKIERTTGRIIWRLGGLNNQFTFINDPIRFTYQHAIRRIPNGHITLYDNGNFHTPQFSRAVEYTLDEINMTATLVWQYRNNPDIFGSWGGYVQRLDSGNTLISWGGTSPTVTEVEPDGTIVFEAAYQAGVNTYRAYKFDWNGVPVSTNHNSSQTPGAFRLYPAYPNPFNPVTKIKFDVPAKTHSNASLQVFDLSGRELVLLINRELKPRTYEAEFDGSNFSSGIYFCRLTAGDFSASQKMILLK